MDARKERGLQLAQHGQIVKLTHGWRVPSQSGVGSYFVRLKKNPTCTCPDFERWQMPCKHIYAVEYLVTWETATDGAQTVTTKTEMVKVTYTQNWPAYNAAQTEEKARFIVLLNALCQLVDQPAQTKGRPRLPLADMVFACVYKVYSCFSSRRFMSDLREAETQEHVCKAAHFNSVSRYLANPTLTETFTQLVTLSSLPLKGIENHFAVDSSYAFTESRSIASSILLPFSFETIMPIRTPEPEAMSGASLYDGLIPSQCQSNDLAFPLF